MISLQISKRNLLPEYSDVLKSGEPLAIFFSRSLTTLASADFIHNANYSVFLKIHP